MRRVVTAMGAVVTGDARADRVVPPSGATAWLTLLASAAMAFLAVFALALCLATGRLAEKWSGALAQSATVRVSAPEDRMDVQVGLILDILAVTPGVGSARVVGPDEMRALLAPWFGADLPVDSLPIPKLIEVREVGDGFDAEGLRLRLSAEVPGATLDDHLRWRRPLVEAASRIRWLGYVALGLIAGVLGAVVTLAARAALFANTQVIEVLRLVGARDVTIARAFVRRFTLRAFAGALGGMALGLISLAILPGGDAADGFLTGLGFAGLEWLWPLTIPPITAIVAFWATRAAALRSLEGVQ